MKIYCDDSLLPRRAIPSFEGINSVYRERDSGLEYIETSRTHDTLRYGKTDGKLPFEFTFNDRYNHKWKVVMDSEDDDVTMFIPCGPQMQWYGADESPTRTGSDAQTQFAQVQFNYQSSSWTSHAGVRITFTAYKDSSVSEWSVDTMRWNNILDLAKKGTEVTGAIIDQIEKLKNMTDSQ